MKKKFRKIRVCNRDWAWQVHSDYEYNYLKVWDDNKKIIYHDDVDYYKIGPALVAKVIKDYLISNGELNASDHFLELL